MTSAKHPSREHALIESLKSLLRGRPRGRYPVGIGDDGAVRRCRKGERLVLTADTFVEGVHFSLKYMSLDEVGLKAMAANLSDCAAMGAQPDGALVQVVFPHKAARIEQSVRRLYKGLCRACRRWNFPVVGGNLSLGPCWMIDIALVGVLGGGPLKRVGAKPGDILWVSGRPGESRAGYELLEKFGRARASSLFRGLVRRHIAPEPRIELGRALARCRLVHAAIDISDGVSKECHTLSYENNLAIELRIGESLASASMKGAAHRLGADWRMWFLNGGEDYELLFAAAPSFRPDHLRSCGRNMLKPVGRCTAKGYGVCARTKSGVSTVVRAEGWDHLEKQEIRNSKHEKRNREK